MAEKKISGSVPQTDILNSGRLDGLPDYRIFRLRHPRFDTYKILKNWSFKLVKDRGSYRVIVTGHINDNTLIQTSFIEKAIFDTVTTENGNVYKLQGFVAEQPHNLFDNGLLNLFENGFPVNWQNIIQSESMRINRLEGCSGNLNKIEDMIADSVNDVEKAKEIVFMNYIDKLRREKKAINDLDNDKSISAATTDDKKVKKERDISKRIEKDKKLHIKKKLDNDKSASTAATDDKKVKRGRKIGKRTEKDKKLQIKEKLEDEKKDKHETDEDPVEKAASNSATILKQETVWQKQTDEIKQPKEKTSEKERKAKKRKDMFKSSESSGSINSKPTIKLSIPIKKSGECISKSVKKIKELDNTKMGRKRIRKTKQDHILKTASLSENADLVKPKIEDKNTESHVLQPNIIPENTTDNEKSTRLEIVEDMPADEDKAAAFKVDLPNEEYVKFVAEDDKKVEENTKDVDRDTNIKADNDEKIEDKISTTKDVIEATNVDTDELIIEKNDKKVGRKKTVSSQEKSARKSLTKKKRVLFTVPKRFK